MTDDSQGSTGDRLLDLLEAFAARSDGVSIADAAAQTRVPLSSAYRFARLLADRGYVVRAPGGILLPGPMLERLGKSANANARLAAIARPALQRLARTTGATVHLGVLEQDMVTYIAKESGGTDDLFTREGMQLEAYCSAIGKLLLADLPDADLNRYLNAGPFVALTPNTLTDPAALRTHLAQVRAQGHAIDDREVSDTLYCVAVPVRDSGGRTVAALSCSSMRWTAAARPPLTALRRAASAIAAAIPA